MSDQDSDELELSLFVRRPTEADEAEAGVIDADNDPLPQPKLTVGVGDVLAMAPDQTTGIMVIAKRNHTKEGDLIGLLEEFILSMECGIYPSERSLQWLAGGLEQWHDNQGRKGLDQCLGLKDKAGQAANVFSRTHREDVIGQLVGRIQVLHYGLDLDLDTCLAILSSWTSNHEWYAGTHKLRQPTPDEDLLRKYWKAGKWAREPESIAAVKERYVDDKAREAFIQAFPIDCWQDYPALKKYL